MLFHCYIINYYCAELFSKYKTAAIVRRYDNTINAYNFIYYYYYYLDRVWRQTERTYCCVASHKHSARAYSSSITENPPLYLIRQRITTAAASFPYQPISVIYLFPPSRLAAGWRRQRWRRYYYCGRNYLKIYIYMLCINLHHAPPSLYIL